MYEYIAVALALHNQENEHMTPTEQITHTNSYGIDSYALAAMLDVRHCQVKLLITTILEEDGLNPGDYQEPGVDGTHFWIPKRRAIEIVAITEEAMETWH